MVGGKRVLTVQLLATPPSAPPRRPFTTLKISYLEPSMQKAKVYAVVGSNIEQLGGELERQCKETSAATESEVPTHWVSSRASSR
jgi:hypothetical protein